MFSFWWLIDKRSYFNFWVQNVYSTGGNGGETATRGTYCVNYTNDSKINLSWFLTKVNQVWHKKFPLNPTDF